MEGLNKYCQIKKKEREKRKKRMINKVGMIIGSLNTFAIKISFELKKIEIF